MVFLSKYAFIYFFIASLKWHLIIIYVLNKFIFSYVLLFGKVVFFCFLFSNNREILYS
jgi:hypothetical protein